MIIGSHINGVNEIIVSVSFQDAGATGMIEGMMDGEMITNSIEDKR